MKLLAAILLALLAVHCGQSQAADSRPNIVFTSDNGPLYDQLGGTDTDFFNSHAGFRGRKGSFYEGGFREPCLVRWPGKIAPGSVSDRVTGFEDWLPTLLDLAGTKPGHDVDGISFAPTLFGKTQEPRPFLYRESPGYGGQQCVRAGDWKAIRTKLTPAGGKKPAAPLPIRTELYNLATDRAEANDVAAEHPDILKKLEAILREQHTPSQEFPIPALDR